jgi:hypothetical protein
MRGAGCALTSQAEGTDVGGIPPSAEGKDHVVGPMLALRLYSRGLAGELTPGIGHDPSGRPSAVLFREPEDRLAIIEQSPAARTFHHLK